MLAVVQKSQRIRWYSRWWFRWPSCACPIHPQVIRHLATDVILRRRLNDAKVLWNLTLWIASLWSCVVICIVWNIARARSADFAWTLLWTIQGLSGLVIKLILLRETCDFRMTDKALFCESLIVLDIELFVKFLVGLKVVWHLLAVLQRCITPAVTFVEPVLSHDADEVDL